MKLFSKIKDKPEHFRSEPCPEFLFVVEKFKTLTPPTHNIIVAEVGIGYGATALQVLERLGENDVYYCFDFVDVLEEFMDDLKVGHFDFKCDIFPIGNSHNNWDSYNWGLSNMLLYMRKNSLDGIFDAVYLDSAHTLFHDGLAVCLLKELIRDGGILILDDVYWTYNSDIMNVARFLTQEQVNDYQILRVQELFLTPDPNWEKLSDDKSWRGIFQKRPCSTKQKE